MTTDPDELSEYYASGALHWPRSVTNLDAKLVVAERIAAHVTDGQLVGIGSGSATYMALWAIGRRVRAESLTIRVVAASYETEAAAMKLGLALLPLGSVKPDWGVDGADEVDPDGRILKGRGGAMFREKILCSGLDEASRCRWRCTGLQSNSWDERSSSLGREAGSCGLPPARTDPS